MNLLAVSDQVVERIYALAAGGHFNDVAFILGCGDLPYPYLEYLLTITNKPLYYVPGNHDPTYDPNSRAACVEGGSNLDLKVERVQGWLIGGLGGSIRYRPGGVNQYTQAEACLRAWRPMPRLLWNRVRYGRALDVLISHSPPFGIHDDETQAHRGLRALNGLIRFARPRYHLHGHTHFYKQNLADAEDQVGHTRVINVYPYKVIQVSND